MDQTDTPARRRDDPPGPLRTLAGRDAFVRVTLRLSPLAAGLAVLLVGFGVLATCYVVLVARGDPGASLRGVGVFPTGAVGDSLLLPLAALVALHTYRGLAEMLRSASASDRPALHAASGRLRAALASRPVAWGPALFAVAIVTWYHWPWLSDSGYWVFEAPAQALRSYSMGFYHAFFMVIAIWWLVALVARFVLVGARLLPAAALEKGTGPGLLRASEKAWRRALLLCLVLTVFVALLYVDRYGLTLPGNTIATDPPTLLSVSLVAPAYVGLFLYLWRWIAPLREAADASG